MAGATYWWAGEVEEIADRLIPKFHDHLNRPDVEIWYLFQDPPTKRAGRVVAGKARKIGGLAAHLVAMAPLRRESLGAESPLDFFVITVASEPWAVMDDEAREALVDHELSHCGVDLMDDSDEDRKLVLLAHDVEEFFEVAKRHGPNRPAAQELADGVSAAAAERLPFPVDTR